jgi:hypothetical protein
MCWSSSDPKITDLMDKPKNKTKAKQNYMK